MTMKAANLFLCSLAAVPSGVVPVQAQGAAVGNTYPDDMFTNLFTYLDRAACNGPKLASCRGVAATI